MPAVTVEDVLVLPRIVASSTGASRPVRRVVTSRQLMEGAGVLLSRPLPLGRSRWTPLPAFEKGGVHCPDRDIEERPHWPRTKN
jgi:hypothetical protein